MRKVITTVAARSTVGDFVRVVISGELAKEIATGCKPVHPISRVEVRKSEVITAGAPPEMAPEAAPVPPPPAEEELPPGPEPDAPAAEELPPPEPEAE
jgi:small subunit ribosomal protein S3Ae